MILPPELQVPLTGPQEYLDRKTNTVCAACFESISDGLTDNEAIAAIKANRGRRFITNQVRDAKTLLPIILTAKGGETFHVQSVGYGSIKVDQCYFEKE